MSLRRFIRTTSERFLRRLRETAESQSATGLEVSDVTIDFSDVARLRADIRLREQTLAECRPTVVDVGASPLHVELIECDACNPSRFDNHSIIRPLHPMGLAAGRTWNGVTVRVVAQLSDSVDLVALPDHLPSIGIDGGGGALLLRALPTVLIDASNTRGVVGFLALDASQSRGYLQLVIATPSTRVALSSAGPAIVEHDKVRITPSQMERIGEELSERCEFLAGELGKNLSARPITVLRRRLPRDPIYGVLACVPREWWGIQSAEARREGAIVRPIASMWWGAGLRPVGERGFELANAVGIAMTLRWLALTDDVQLRRSLRAYEETSKHSPGTSQGDGANVAAIHRLGLALFDALTHGECKNVLQKLTNEHWGSELDSDYAFKQLIQAGLELPAQ